MKLNLMSTSFDYDPSSRGPPNGPNSERIVAKLFLKKVSELDRDERIFFFFLEEKI